MASASPHDSRQNEAVAHALIENEPPVIAAQVGLHALAQLADMMPAKEFLDFVNAAVESAHSGQPPQDESEQSEQQESQQTPGSPQPTPAQ